MDGDLCLSFNSIQHNLLINSHGLEQLKCLRDAFLLFLSRSLIGGSPEPSTAAELVLRYLQFVLSSDVSPVLVESLLLAFERDFLVGSDIYSLIPKVATDHSLRKALLTTYHAASSASRLTRPRNSALIEAAEQGQAQIYAVFGGQGTSNPTCIKELVDLHGIYASYLSDLISGVTPLLKDLCRLPETREHYCGRTLDLDEWLREPSRIPSRDFVSTAAVSFPVIGVLGLAHFCVACRVLGKTPGELRSTLKGVTGHSQGIIVAAAVALSDTWESFYDAAKLVVEMLFWLGYECHQGAPRSSVPVALLQESLEMGECRPSCMLSLRGLDRAQVESLLVKSNRGLPATGQVQLALANARDNFVVAGPVSSLVHLNADLRAMKADSGVDQSRVPFSNRKPVIQHQFLPISAPFHTSHLREAAEDVKLHLFTSTISASQLMTPVYHSRTGDDLRDSGITNLIDELVDAITCQKCDWRAAVAFPNATHVLAFGGGGIGELVMKVKDGSGVRTIIVSDLEPYDSELGSAADLYSPLLLESSKKIQSWGEKFQPHLARSATGDWVMETKLSRLLGCPPIMVAGMTPTTAHWDFVSTIMNAGYHVELAGGGYHNADAMSSAITQLIASVPAGKGITCNLIYSSPHAMAWQVAMLRRLAQNGVPIDGLTIGAGVPSPDIITEYVNTLGLKHISLKPGSSAAIKQVIEIAKAHPDFPIILQWTGGRGGGHHSYEDFHSPILNLYNAIRKCANIVLVAGSGFGGADDTYPYLTGSWAAQFGCPLMPFDGILLGSRMMVAREAHTAHGCKELIHQIAGVSDSHWEKSYRGSAGGIVTVQSEMRQPIHKIANRGVLLWAEMDKLIFTLPRGERVAKLLEHKDYIIRKLNADFAKPWFGQTLDGEVAQLSEMTYAEVLSRLVSLMYVKHQKRWIDGTYTTFVVNFASRVLERFPPSSNFEFSITSLDEPLQLLQDFFSACPQALLELINPEDEAFFLMMCKSRGQKPVNFVPSLDNDFELYFKKDSLWQSEDLDAVIDQDAGRVCILHGPVAAQYSQDGDESAADILDGITRAHVAMFRQDHYPESTTSSSQSGSVSPDSWSMASPHSSLTTPLEGTPDIKSPRAYSNLFAEAGAPMSATFMAGSCSKSSALIRTLFKTEHIFEKGYRKLSPFRRVLEPRQDASLQFDRENSRFVLAADSAAARPLLEITCQDDLMILVKLHQQSAYRNESVVLPFEYQLNWNMVPMGLSEITAHRNERIKAFYSKLWFDEDINLNATVNSTFYGPEMELTREMLQNLVSTVGLSYSHGETMFSNSDVFPISVGVIIVWDVITKPLVLRDIDGDLLRLVHQSNTFEYCGSASPLRIGDSVQTKSNVKAIYIEEAGKYVVVEAQIERSGELVMIVTSTFLFKGSYDDFSSTFRREKEQDMVLEIGSLLDEAIIRDREWFVLHEPTMSLLDATLLFRLQTDVTWKHNKVFKSMRVTGPVFRKSQSDDLQEIGMVDFTDTECVGNPVTDFLERKGSSLTCQTDLTNPGWSGDATMDVQVPSNNEAYARISRDYNPIHVSSIFSDWAELPGTITHGMYTSAVAAGVLEHLAANGSPGRFYRYSATFTGMVLPSDRLTVRLRHTGMVQGRMVFEISAFKKGTDDKVLDAKAEIEQPRTAYIFTGQGSQVQGMGMELYNSSPVAKSIWDDMDKYLYDSYGWSILHIVRNNPKALTVYFGGKRGRKIRENYLAMETETQLPDGRFVSKPILTGLTSNSRSYTFAESRGLLFSTQFAQPAILLLQKAAFEDMRVNGFIQKNATYAGHSLGEYGSLSAFSGFLPLQSLMDVVFYRGLTMQLSMDRDEHGETNFSMVAANPKRVAKGFNEKALSCVVGMIATESEALLEIVNYNVEGEQYVCAGTLQNLHVLGLVLNYLSKAADAERLVDEALHAHDLPSTALHKFVVGFLMQAQKVPHPIQLQRGVATIPLKGIDVPFHSTHLRPGVKSYRKFLQQRIVEGNIHPDKLVGRFVPNVMAQPFSLDQDYVAEAFRLTQSPELEELLEQSQESTSC